MNEHKKLYEVEFTATMLVEADSEDEAVEIAQDLQPDKDYLYIYVNGKLYS